jgi:hypothetical protein
MSDKGSNERTLVAGQTVVELVLSLGTKVYNTTTHIHSYKWDLHNNIYTVWFFLERAL